MSVSLVTIPNVPILEAGVEYSLSTGRTTFTPEDLRDVVTAANEDFSIPSPRAGIGHIDPRYNDTQTYDGTPAFGKYINLRLGDNSMVVYADWVGCPKWLAEIGPAAFPSRSIEGAFNVESQSGKRWRFVLTSCKSLGVVWPGVTVLEDLPLYYGEEIPPGVQLVPEAMAAGGGLMAQASANLDDVRRAFYTDYVAANKDAEWWWIRAVLTDPNELVVEDDESGQLFKLTFQSDPMGSVTFGDPQAVRIEYIPDSREALKAAASHVAATLVINRTVMASWPTRAASRPEPQGGGMDPKEIRQRLNLPEDASDEQVKASLRDLNTAVAASEGETEPPVPTPETTPAEEDEESSDEESTEEESADEDGGEEPVTASNSTVMVDKKMWEQVTASLTKTNVFIDKQEKQERDQLVMAAINDGRIPPASKKHWLQLLKTDPNAKATLAKLAKGLLPIEERGHAHDMTEGNQALEQQQVSTWSSELFPEVRRANAANGQGSRSRVMSDAHYRR